jgi:hypothetical protein
MKKFSMIFALLFTYSLHVYADCNSDISQMTDQILQFKSITTPDGNYRFTQVSSYPSPMEDGFCVTSATPFVGIACNNGDCCIYYLNNCSKIRWEMGKWGSTFTCAR